MCLIISEVVLCALLAHKLVQSSVPSANGRKKIFRRKPTICADNFLFDNACCEWIGKNNFSSIGTTARNVLPDGIGKKYLHIEKNKPGCPRSKVA